MGRASIGGIEIPKPRFGEFLAWAILPPAAAAWTVANDPLAPIVAGTALVAILASRLFGKLPNVPLGPIRCVGVAWAALAFFAAGGNELILDRSLMRLEAIDPQAYLARVREVRSDEYWLQELARLDPVEHERVVGLRANRLLRDQEKRAKLERGPSAEGGARPVRGVPSLGVGELSAVSVAEWKRASHATRATIALAIAHVVEDGAGAPLSGSADRIRPIAAELLICMDEAAMAPDTGSVSVLDLGVLCAIQLGHGG